VPERKTRKKARKLFYKSAPPNSKDAEPKNRRRNDGKSVWRDFDDR
jgi:hypothetical protein